MKFRDSAGLGYEPKSLLSPPPEERTLIKTEKGGNEMQWAFDLLIIIKYKDEECPDHMRKKKIQCLVFKVFTLLLSRLLSLPAAPLNHMIVGH